MGAGRPLADTPGPAGAGTSACELSAVESLAMSDLFLHDVSFGPICALQESVVDRAVSLEAEYRMLLGLVEKLQK